MIYCSVHRRHESIMYRSRVEHSIQWLDRAISRLRYLVADGVIAASIRKHFECCTQGGATTYNTVTVPALHVQYHMLWCRVVDADHVET